MFAPSGRCALGILLCHCSAQVSPGAAPIELCKLCLQVFITGVLLVTDWVFFVPPPFSGASYEILADAFSASGVGFIFFFVFLM